MNSELWKQIKGQLFARRAFEIALLGRHSICFIGGHGTGKTMFRNAIRGLGCVTFEALPCPCGNLADPLRACLCTLREIDKHKRGIPVTEMIVSLGAVREHEIAQSYECLEAVIERVQIASGRGVPTQMSADGLSLLRMACKELRLNMWGRGMVLCVAGTIARLEGADTVGAVHVAEAVQYHV